MSCSQTLTGCQYTYGSENIKLDSDLLTEEKQYLILRDFLNEMNKIFYKYASIKSESEKVAVEQEMKDLLCKMQEVTGCMEKNTRVVSSLGNAETPASAYNKLVNMRKDLDLKLQEVYTTNTSMSNERKQLNDSTAYASVLWTILATTIIYFVFVKL